MTASPAIQILRKGLLLTLAASAVFAAGWLAGRRIPGGKNGVSQPNSDAVAVAALTDSKSGGNAPPPGKSPTGTTASSRSELPESAAKLLNSLDPSGGLKSQAAILQYASGLDAATARAAAQSFMGRGWSTDKNTQQLSAALFTRWAELDPQGVIESARTSGDQYFRWNAMSAGFDALSRKDPSAAWQTASSFGPLKAEAQRSVIYALGSQNPSMAFKFASEAKGV